MLDAGKTTLLNHRLTQTEGQRVAVIVSESGAVNVDASLVSKTEEQTTELSTGSGEALPVAQSSCLTPGELEIEPEPGQAPLPNLLGRVHVDAGVTVVDAAQFFPLWNRPDTIPGDGLGRGFGELLAITRRPCGAACPPPRC